MIVRIKDKMRLSCQIPEGRSPQSSTPVSFERLSAKALFQTNIHIIQKVPKDDSPDIKSGPMPPDGYREKSKNRGRFNKKSNAEHQALGSYEEYFHDVLSPKDSPEPSGFF